MQLWELASSKSAGKATMLETRAGFLWYSLKQNFFLFGKPVFAFQDLQLVR